MDLAQLSSANYGVIGQRTLRPDGLNLADALNDPSHETAVLAAVQQASLFMILSVRKQ